MSVQTLARNVLRLAAPLTLCLSYGCAEGPVEPQAGNAASEPFAVVAELMDFDSGVLPESLEVDGAGVRVVAAADGGEGAALELIFPASDNRPTIQFRPDDAWDWSGNENIHLAIDLSNAGDESVQLYMSLTDAHGGTTSRSVNIAVGEANTYYFVFDSGLREDPPPWETTDEMFVYRRSEKALDLGAITDIALSTEGTLVDNRVVIDNLRLRRNP